jgi:hypothetical protein
MSNPETTAMGQTRPHLSAEEAKAAAMDRVKNLTGEWMVAIFTPEGMGAKCHSTTWMWPDGLHADTMNSLRDSLAMRQTQMQQEASINPLPQAEGVGAGTSPPVLKVMPGSSSLPPTPANHEGSPPPRGVMTPAPQPATTLLRDQTASVPPPAHLRPMETPSPLPSQSNTPGGNAPDEGEIPYGP